MNRLQLYFQFVFVALLLVVVCDCYTRANMRHRIKKLDTPYVTLYANQYYRGQQYVEYLKGGCKNLPDEYSSWASSINTHNRCVDVCTAKDCEGSCVRMYPASGADKNLGLKLSMVGVNDQIVSLKSCYTSMKKRF